MTGRIIPILVSDYAPAVAGGKDGAVKEPKKVRATRKARAEKERTGRRNRPGAPARELSLGEEILVPATPGVGDGGPLRIRLVAMEELRDSPFNFRSIDPEADAALRSSLATFGLGDLPCWNERTGFVIGGHQRLRILRDAGETAALVVVKDLDPERERLMNVALNSPYLQGKFLADVGASIAELREAVPGDLIDVLRLAELEKDVAAAIQRGAPPAEFPRHDEATAKTDHVCPRCGYEF